MTGVKRCRVCKESLSPVNWNITSEKKNDKICKSCKSKELKSIVVEVTSEKRGGHTITRSGSKAPVITVDNADQTSIKEMIRDTELFRIEEVLKLIVPGNEDKVRKVGIDYLLKVNDLLNARQLAEVVNQANLMMRQTGVEDCEKLKVAIALRNFISSKDGKKDKPMSFEEIMKGRGVGEIEIDEI